MNEKAQAIGCDLSEVRGQKLEISLTIALMASTDFKALEAGPFVKSK